MILIGDKNIPFENIATINEEKDIENTLPNSTVLFSFDFNLMNFCKSHDVAYGVKISSIKEVIYSNALNAKYIICEKELSKQVQDIATNYMFDSRILAIIVEDNEIEELALNNIDGVIYKNILK